MNVTGAALESACKCNDGTYPVINVATGMKICMDCPPGGRCVNNGLVPRVEGSNFEADPVTGVFRISYCPRGHVMVRSSDPGSSLFDTCVECPINKYLLCDDARVEEAADAASMCRDCVRGADCTGGIGVVPLSGFWRNTIAERVGKCVTVKGPEGPVTVKRRDMDDSADNGTALIFPCAPGVCLGDNKCREGHEGPVRLPLQDFHELE